MSKPYTQREIRFIEDNFETNTDAFIAQRLKRTILGIKIFRQKIGLYKSEEDLSFKKSAEHMLVASRKEELKALLHYISNGKGGEVAKQRVEMLQKSLIKRIGHNYVYYKKRRRKTPMPFLASIYELHLSGLRNFEIMEALETKDRGLVERTIKEISPYTGENTMMLLLKSKV